MKRLLTWLRIDPEQYVALLRLAWRMDLRTTQMGFGWYQEGRSPIMTLFSTLIYYLILGFIFAWISYKATSVFLGASLAAAGMIFILGSILLIEFNAIVISPDDYHILGFQPVSSRTYFFARLTNVLAYILVFNVVLSAPMVIMHTVRGGGFHPLRGLAALLAMVLLAVFVVFLVVLTYGQFMRMISPQRLKNFLVYLQVTVTMIIYTGYLFLPEMLEKYLVGASVQKQAWLFLLPTTWFASIIELAYPGAAKAEWLGAGLAVFSVFLLGHQITRHISLDYARRLALYMEAQSYSIPKTRQQATSQLRLSRIFWNPEDRVIMRLAQGQFRYDTKFRLAVLGMYPFLILYFYMGLRQGTLSDPFISGVKSVQQYFFFFFVLLMLPLALKQSIESSDAYEASWIFYATPCKLNRLVLAGRNVLFLVVTLPALIFLSGVFLYYFKNTIHALVHAGTIGLLSFLFLQIAYLITPKLPFSQPKVRGEQTRIFTLMLILMPFLGILVLFGITEFIYPSTFLTIGLYIGLIALGWVLEKLIQRRIDFAARKLHYTG